jgi:hypothetical protein
MKINNNHADELILSEFTHLRTAHIYKQNCRQDFDLEKKIEINKLPYASKDSDNGMRTHYIVIDY